MNNKTIKHTIAFIVVAILVFLSVTSCYMLPILIASEIASQIAGRREAKNEQTQQEEPEQARRANTPTPTPEIVYSEVIYTEIPYSELNSKSNSVRSQGQGFIVEAYTEGLKSLNGRFYYITMGPRPSNANAWSVFQHDYYDNYNENDYQNYARSHEFEIYDIQTNERIERDKLYKFYLCIFFESNGANRIILDRIEGLMTLEEVEAFNKAKEEARNNFIMIPSDFEPADYNARDLFNVVAYVEGVDFSIAIPNLFNLNTRFVSDVVFVRQDGTDIWFRTDDNAISQNMRINSRAGLTSGQKVRLYYWVTKAQYRLPVWQVIAIERL